MKESNAKESTEIKKITNQTSRMSEKKISGAVANKTKTAAAKKPAAAKINTKSADNKTVQTDEGKSKTVICEYKYTLEDSYAGAMLVYKSKLKSKVKRMLIVLPILTLMMIGLLVWDIIDKQPIAFDIVLLCALVMCEVLLLLSPVLIKNSQKKMHHNLKFDEKDLYRVEIDEQYLKDSFIKNNNVMNQSVNELKNISIVGEDKERIIVIFSNGAFFCVLRKNALQNATSDELLSRLKLYAIDYSLAQAQQKAAIRKI